MAKQIGSRELKTRLGTYLRQVQEGAVIIVTDRGRPVAELRPLAETKDPLEKRIAEMVARGEASLKSAEPLKAFTPVKVRGDSVAATISEDREDRF